MEETSSPKKHAGLFFAIFVLSLFCLNIGMFVSIKLLTVSWALIGAGVLMAVAVAAFFWGKKQRFVKWLNPAFNSLAAGLLISVYYLQTGKPFDLTAVCLMQAGVVLLFALTYWCLEVEHFNRTMLIVNLIVGLAAVVAAIILWDKENTFYQQLMFTALFYISFVLGQLLYTTKKYTPWFCFSVVYFTALSIALFVALLILSEGDSIGDFFAGIGGSAEAKKRKGKRIGSQKKPPLQ